MDTSTYDANIRQAEQEREAIYAQLERLVAEYVSASTAFFQKEFQSKIEDAISNRPKVSQELGVEKLRQLKAELKATIEEIPHVVSEYMDRDELWVHRSTPLEAVTRELGIHFKVEGKHKADEQGRPIMGEVGQLLVKYGFDKIGESGSWEDLGNSKLSYKYWVPLREEMVGITKRYTDVFEKYVAAQLKVVQLKLAKEQAIAKDLWNQA